ncbi:RING-H2 finger protein ATL74-like [Nymphaea colorata]|nr:RING-H2 finger protein ATL74-like [Nymphaea colorata]
MDSRYMGIVAQVMIMVIIISVMLLSFGLWVLVVMHLSVVGRALGNGIRTRNLHRKDDERAGMDIDELQRLPWFHFGTGGEKGGSTACAVCLEGLQRGDRCRLLPFCRHSFHVHCVDPWLIQVSVCPICRASTKLKRERGCARWGRSFGWVF